MLLFRVPCALVLIFWTANTFASSGDRSHVFESCVSRCWTTQCHPSMPNTLSLPLRLTRWTCTDDCKYVCMHQITDRDVRKGGRVQQYYGKWPFWRLAGMQEPAAVAFSLLNLWAHVQGYLKIRTRIPAAHPMKPYYIMWSLVSMNAWVWSAVFHTRDLPTTEKLDYFSAALSIVYALFYTAIRMFHIYPPPSKYRLLSSQSDPHPNSIAHKAWSCICTLAYVAHVSYLTFLPRFDYTYNMVFNVTVGLIHNAMWTVYALPTSISIIRRFPSRSKSYRPHFVSNAGLFVLLTMAATALELYDFPPLGRVIDAHSLWHLATVPITLLWYNFLVEDALDDSWSEHRS